MSAQRTIYAAHLSTCKTRGKPFNVLPNSTLNQKFNVHKDEVPQVNQYPDVGYLAIGNRGLSYDITSNNTILLKTVPHSPRDAALYNHIPFIARRENDDLSPEERSKYRMRVPTTINNERWVLYYLRVIDKDNSNPSVEYRSVNNTNVDTTVFTPSISDLSPQHPDISDTAINTVARDYLTSSDKASLILTREDIVNIREACEVLYGDPRHAFINEIAVVSGVDRVLEGTFGATTSNYIEVVSAQVNSFLAPRHDLTENTTEVVLRLDIGSSEPLYLL